MLQLPAFLVAFSWTPPQLPTSAWDWGPKSASPPSSDTATIWCKYPGNGEVLFSALFYLWSQLQRHISALLKEFVDNQLAEWEGVNSTGTTGLCSQERKISWATLADFYLPPIWERGKKSVFFFSIAFLCLSLNSYFIQVSFITSPPVWSWKSQLLWLFCMAPSLKFPC